MRWDTSHSELRSWVLGCRQQFWFSRFCQLSLDPQVSVDWLQLVQRSAVPHFFDIVLPCPDCSECLRSPCYLGQFCHMVLVRRNEIKSYSQNVMAQLSMSSSSLILRHHFFSRSSCAPYLTTSGMYACIHCILMFLVYVCRQEWQEMLVYWLRSRVVGNSDLLVLNFHQIWVWQTFHVEHNLNEKCRVHTVHQ